MKLTIKTSGNRNLTIPVKCPACGRRIDIKARSATRGSKVRCSCGRGAVELSNDGAVQAQRALDNLFNKLGKLGR